MLEEDLKKRCVTEGQLLFEFMREKPEYVQVCVDRIIREVFEERMNDRRDELIKRFDKAIDGFLVGVAREEFMQVYMLSEGDRKRVKPLADGILERARKHVARLMQMQFDYTVDVKRRVERLEERLQQDDSDWWKRGGETQGPRSSQSLSMTTSRVRTDVCRKASAPANAPSGSSCVSLVTVSSQSRNSVALESLRKKGPSLMTETTRPPELSSPKACCRWSMSAPFSKGGFITMRS